MNTDDTDVTELTTLTATKVAGVATPANGTPFLVLKAADPETEKCSTCKGDGKIRAGKITCPDCKGTGEVAVKAEADDMQDQVTKDEADDVEETVTEDDASKALTAAEREKMPASSFAYIDKNGGKHLPIHDADHVKSAQGRVGQQDFSEAKGDPKDAQSKAEAKIQAAADKLAAKGQVQDSLSGTQTPQEVGHLAAGQSGTAGNVTGEVRDGVDFPDASLTLGGQASYVIPDEAKTRTNNPIPPTTDGRGAESIRANERAAVAAKSVVSLVGAIDVIASQREAVKDGKYLQATPEQSSTPGNMPWESYDSATLAQVAQCLAGCAAAIDAIQQREQIEAMTGQPGDYQDSWDLQVAGEALDCAMGIAARLAFQEAASGEAAKNTTGVVKAGRTLSGKNELALRAARDHLNAVIDGAEKSKATTGGESTSEEDKIVTEVTKSELAEAIVLGVQAAIKAERKQDKKARKAAEEEAAKVSNNNGDLSQADIKPTKETTSDDVNAVGAGTVKPEFVNKSESDMDPAVKAVADQISELTKSIASVQETVAKIAARPRPGGPSLDGQARGITPAGEGRQSDVTKSAVDAEIETLEKGLAEATNPQIRDEYGQKLTRLRLTRLHETGQL